MNLSIINECLIKAFYKNLSLTNFTQTYVAMLRNPFM